ncbi:MAG: hypothetical protein ABI699_03720 [Caldimonas sp.]
MKKIAAVLAIGFLSGATCAADQKVRGPAKTDATVVAPQAGSPTHGSRLDNPGTKGSVNPPAGKEWTKDPYATPLLRDARPLNRS